MPASALASRVNALAGTRPVVVIPARYHSTRFPGKPLADLCGRPLIEHVWRRASAARSIGAVVVATDDQRIADTVERFGGIAWMTDPRHRSGSDRLAEVAQSLTADLIVNVQGDEPLVTPSMIEIVLEPLSVDPTLAMTTLRRRIDDSRVLDDPHVVKVVVDREGFALYFSRAPIPYCRRQPDVGAEATARADAWQHIGLYGYRRSFLLAFARLAHTPLELAESLEQLRALEHGYRIKTVETSEESIGVDTPEDLEAVRQVLQQSAMEPHDICGTRTDSRSSTSS